MSKNKLVLFFIKTPIVIYNVLGHIQRALDHYIHFEILNNINIYFLFNVNYQSIHKTKKILQIANT